MGRLLLTVALRKLLVAVWGEQGRYSAHNCGTPGIPPAVVFQYATLLLDIREIHFWNVKGRLAELASGPLRRLPTRVLACY